jgi:hypothetical protein
VTNVEDVVERPAPHPPHREERQKETAHHWSHQYSKRYGCGYHPADNAHAQDQPILVLDQAPSALDAIDGTDSVSVKSDLRDSCHLVFSLPGQIV